MKFILCVFGYIVVSSVIASAAFARTSPRWAGYAFLVTFIIGLVFVIGYATSESGRFKTQLSEALGFIKMWGSAMLWLVGVSLVIAVLLPS